MPELPEVETTMRGLAAIISGKRLARVEARRPDLRFPLPPDFAARMEGQMVLRIDRRAKYMLARLDGGLTWLTHLGMSGRMMVGQGPAPKPAKHDHIIIETSDGGYAVYQDARRFGFMDLFPTSEEASHPRLVSLGIEPLSGLTASKLKAMLAGKSSSIKAALLDQRLIAGLGNIYVCEALFRARVRPEREAGSMKQAELKRLTVAIPEVLREAISAGGSSLRDYRQPSGELGYFKASWGVYGREGEDCIICSKNHVRRIVQSGRSSFYCPTCQR